MSQTRCHLYTPSVTGPPATTRSSECIRRRALRAHPITCTMHARTTHAQCRFNTLDTSKCVTRGFLRPDAGGDVIYSDSTNAFRNDLVEGVYTQKNTCQYLRSGGPQFQGACHGSATLRNCSVSLSSLVRPRVTRYRRLETPSLVLRLSSI